MDKWQSVDLHNTQPHPPAGRTPQTLARSNTASTKHDYYAFFTVAIRTSPTEVFYTRHPVTADVSLQANENLPAMRFYSKPEQWQRTVLPDHFKHMPPFMCP